MSDPAAPTAAEFDQYAGTYRDLLHDPVRDLFAPAGGGFFVRRKLELILEFFARRNQKTTDLSWLDIGCGQGDLLRLGGPQFAHVAGCDLSEGMLQACEGIDVRKQRSPTLLPFEDASFDFVTAVCVYHHVLPGDRLPLTREAHRVLKPGGVFCVIEHNPLNPVTRLIVWRAPVDADAKLVGAGAVRRLMRSSDVLPADTRYFLLFPERAYRPLQRAEAMAGKVPLGGQYAVFGERRTRS
jgi:SAM-dependent methyltransferase